MNSDQAHSEQAHSQRTSAAYNVALELVLGPHTLTARHEHKSYHMVSMMNMESQLITCA